MGYGKISTIFFMLLTSLWKPTQKPLETILAKS